MKPNKRKTPESKPGVAPSAKREMLFILRITLLQAAAEACPHPIPLTAFLTFARVRGCRVDEPQIEQEIQYLLDKGFVVDVKQEISPEIHRYRIHANGRDYLAEKGMDD